MGEKWLTFFRENKSKVIGALIGLAIGIIILSIGFWRTLFLALCVGVGYALGIAFTSESNLGHALRRIFHIRKRNTFDE
nr:DUF2273 domain-containing protein [Maliibacterium massiliense]